MLLVLDKGRKGRKRGALSRRRRGGGADSEGEGGGRLEEVKRIGERKEGIGGGGTEEMQRRASISIGRRKRSKRMR